MFLKVWVEVAPAKSFWESTHSNTQLPLKFNDDLEKGFIYTKYKILNEFPHPSLVSVYEFGLLSEGWSYLVLELIDGKSATGHVRSLYGSQRLYKCLQIAIKISEAFGSLHQMNWFMEISNRTTSW